MMKKNMLLLAAVMLSGAQLSCSSDSEENLGEAEKVVNMLSQSEPIVLTQEQRQFANDNNHFTLNFLKTVSDADKSGKSFIYSPLSITYVLGMVNDAATGQTEQELEQTLGFHQGGIQAVNDYCRKLVEGLPKVDPQVTLNIANAIFLNKDYTLKEKFQKDMETYYDAEAEALDFNSSKTLGHINGWCKEKTKGMIPTILNEVKPDMVSYLLNAVYFKADWTSKFDSKNTKTETFTTEGEKTQLPLMRQNVLISYIKTPLFSAVKIPYGTGLWNMMVLLPEEGYSTESVISHLAAYGLEGVEGAYGETTDGLESKREYRFSPYEVDLKLPRFETDSDTDDINGGLIRLLQTMGIRQAFDSDFAQIPNMCDNPVYIAMMRQKAKIKVNEEGSEAAAVTVAGMDNLTSIGPDPVYPKATFHANRPFVYIISEASSGVILFVGKYTGSDNPR